MNTGKKCTSVIIFTLLATCSLPKQIRAAKISIVKDANHHNTDAAAVIAAVETQTDACSTIICPSGRQCKVNSEGHGECVCGDEKLCEGRVKIVCGTDGKWYPSFCELHRVACVEKRHISVNRWLRDCRQNEDAVKDGKDLKQVDIDLNNANQRTDDVSNVIKKKNKAAEDDGSRIENEKEDITEERTYVTRMCTSLELSHLKNNIISFHCSPDERINCLSSYRETLAKAEKYFTIADKTRDGLLNEWELKDMRKSLSQAPGIDKLTNNEPKEERLICGMEDMLNYDDKDEDGFISLIEFFKAFDIPLAVLDTRMQEMTISVVNGANLELKCDLEGMGGVIWSKDGAELNQSESISGIKVLPDASLYFHNIGLQHVGNYTCSDRADDTLVQMHFVRVLVPPIVLANPQSQYIKAGYTAVLRCRVDGIPEPRVIWEKNEKPLPKTTGEKHYILLNNNATLAIQNSVGVDHTAAYKCFASNVAGINQALSTVFVGDADVPTKGDTAFERFAVFHDHGLAIYDPDRCYTTFKMAAKDPIGHVPGETLCNTRGPCEWGPAVDVRGRFIYVAQPSLRRLLVLQILTKAATVTKIIDIGSVAVSLHYHNRTDVIWLVTTTNLASGHSVFVIREASTASASHEPISVSSLGGAKWDKVSAIFLPPLSIWNVDIRWGIALHRDANDHLYTFDTDSTKFLNDISLSQYNCTPRDILYLQFGAKLLVSCTGGHNARLVVDLITNSVIELPNLTGRLHISPDGRYLISTRPAEGAMSVIKMDYGGYFGLPVTAYSNVKPNYVAFFATENLSTYEIFATGEGSSDIFYMNLASGRQDTIAGTGSNEQSAGRDRKRSIISGGPFDEYILASSYNSIVVINGRRRHVQCEWEGLGDGHVTIWLSPPPY